MIDWIDATVPFDWDVPINGGAVVHYRADGSPEYGVHKTLRLKGSYDAGIMVRTVERGFLEIKGNPAKFLQGHNLFGTDDVKGLIIGALIDVCEAVELCPSASNLSAWRNGEIALSRLDLTYMYELPSSADVRLWLEAVSKTACVKWRGRGLYDEGTLYFGRAPKGKRASPWQMKLYHKGAEILVPGHRLPQNLSMREALEEWAANKLRIEITLRSQELKRLGLLYVRDWTGEIVAKIYEAYLSKLNIGEVVMVEENVVDTLPVKLQNIFLRWKTGVDIRKLYSRSAFYRYRAEILSATGHDIGALCHASGVVVPLRRTLEAKPADAPDWASDLLYNPYRYLKDVA